MPLTPSTVKRSTDATGDDIATFDNGSGQKVQAAALVDGSGNHAGVTGNALQVNAASLPLPSGAATEASLLNVSAGTQLAKFGACDVDAASATLTYVGKEDKDGNWLVQKIDTTSGTAIRYATILNNGAVLAYSAAWTARATLTYGTFGSAF